MVDSTAPYAQSTQAETLAAQQREAAGAAQAAAINAAYLSNTLPVLPKYAAGGGAQYTAAQEADAAAEAAKYASFNAPIDYAKYANVPLSQMPANVASRVQDYYAAHPTAAAQAITAQYAAVHGVGAEANPYNPESAAGIAWEVSRTGGVTTGALAGKAIGEGYQGPIMAVSGISTVPTRDLSSGMLSGSKMVAAIPGGTTTAYMPFGEFVQIRMPESKLLLSKETGELGVYQQPFGHSQFMLTGGGGRAALQSGMFTIEKAETPYVIEKGDVGTYVMPSGKGLSRLGAEAYGGFVRPLSTENLLAPNEQVSRYFGAGGDINLANLVIPVALGKAEAPGAKIPWSISEESPVIQYMDKGGIIPGSAITVPSGGRLIGGKTVAGAPTITETGGAAALPAPFVSVSQPAETPKTDVFSQVGAWFEGAEKTTSDILGFSKMAPVTTEQVKSTAPYLAIVPGATPVGMAMMTPGISEYATEYVKGEVMGLQTKPLQTLASFGIGLGMGAVFKGVEVGVGAARATAAPKIISEGGVYRAADIFATGVMKRGPQALGALYALDIGVRATQKGTDISPAAAGRLGGIVATEARPMTIGGMIGYAAPTKAYEAARGAQIGYRQAQVEIAGERNLLLQSKEVSEPISLTRVSEGVSPQGKLPSVKESQYVFETATDVGVPRVIATTKAGEVVGAVSYHPTKGATGEPAIFIDYVASRQAGVGTRLLGEIKTIAGEEGAPTIIGKSVGRSVGFWQKMGAEVPGAAETKSIYPFELKPGRIPAVTPAAPAYVPISPEQVSFKDVATYIYSPKISAAKIRAGEALGGFSDIFAGRTGEVTVGRSVELGAKPTERLKIIYEGVKALPETVKTAAGVGKTPASEIVRSYYPYEGIEKVAYPKAAEAKITPEISRSYYPYEGIEKVAYGPKEPISIKVKAYMQEHPTTTVRDVKSAIIRPSKEISDINKMYELGKQYAAQQKAVPTGRVPVGARKRTTLNIFKPEKPVRNKYGIQTEKPAAKPSGATAEVRTGRGVSIVEARETARTSAQEQARGVELDIRGLPVYPSAPSPVQKQRYRVEEETQYLVLPPGMTSPGPKRVTVQEVMQIPSVGISTVQVQVQRVDPLSRLVQDILPKSEVVQERQRVAERERVTKFEVIPTTGITTVPRTMYTTIPKTEITVVPKTTTVTAPKTEITTIPKLITNTVPRTEITTIPRQPLEPTTIPKLFGFPALGGGGVAGGIRKGSRGYVEVLGFETSRGRKGAWVFGKRKGKK